MSASDPNSKIDLLDGPEVVSAKLKKAHCAPKEAEGNGVLSFVEYVLFPIAQLTGNEIFHVPRPEKHGGPVDYTSFDGLKADYLAGEVAPPPPIHVPYRRADREVQLSPPDLKAGVAAALNALLAPVQNEFATNEEFRKVEALAYPAAVAAPKKKKEKKIGTGYVKKKEEEGGDVVALKPEVQAAGTSADDAMAKLSVDKN